MVTNPLQKEPSQLAYIYATCSLYLCHANKSKLIKVSHKSVPLTVNIKHYCFSSIHKYIL